MLKLLQLLLVICLLHSASLMAQTLDLSSTGELLDGIAATVNEGVVLKSEVTRELRRIIENLRAQDAQIPPTSTLASQILERLIIRRIQLQRAERIGIRIPDEQLNITLADIAQRNAISLSELPTMLAQQGIEYTIFRSEMREQLTIDQLRQRDVITRINVTPRELEEHLARLAGRATQNEEFRLSHILISIPSDATVDNISAAESNVFSILERARNGESFFELAVANSDGQSALQGGDLGWRRGNELPTLFADIVPELEPGQISEPTRSASGFHLIRLDERRGADPIMEQQTHARHILLTTNEVLDDDAVRQKLMAIRQQISAGDDFAAVATVMSEDPGSAVNGGDLGWSGPGIFVPEFQAVCDSLEPGEISEPFQSPFGWHIVLLLDRRVQDMTEEVERREAIMAIRNSKLEEETELWTRRLRDQAFVEYKL
ncbi:MAG: peptidylprolyl isomerase [Gammaproteobacteria bacterium]|jgi:peptidyl-prolyl cis-trans isomerase SurA|nr:molecular chaperone SurA [Chromatiales bacterium]MCP4925712.1 molecular chaperone SurA [Gammaproteobacteria bacterium]MDP7154333.1 peptidylprolyl isomerase [Gammaproteobacteria bacterium]MDP7296371.1 peptidylprolyl isomerase [Gammaproteobacteria bacterium]MDP7418714.1 peptidylprolyl isomerase [Gammaproteobacteria bacterium]